MTNPATALTTAIEDPAKVANTPLFSTVIDKLLGFKISEWGAQGDAIKNKYLMVMRRQNTEDWVSSMFLHLGQMLT